jgi:23S rRNA (guanine2445-N2)-methyltransferase / 23S rRNA (guanine2069-N7)-methyltransferase
MENILANELKTLGINIVKTTVAGVSFEGDLETAYRACLWSRIASRILLKLSEFPVKTQQDLYKGVQQINWSEHLRANGSFAVSFSAKSAPAINNTHFGALKVKDAIVDQMRQRFGERPSIDIEKPDIRINVHLHREQAQLSLDLSGESLHRRGYRDITIAAPIKENLAAGLLLASHWPAIAQEQGSLIDPMCGSGTLLLEGAMIAADYAPGLLRDYFGFFGWKKHDPACWRRLTEEANQRKRKGLTQLPIIAGFDHDRRCLLAARTHISNAGLQDHIHLERRSIEDAKPASSWQAGLVVCNPPYGERLGSDLETAELYKQFGQTLKHHFIGWRAALIISQPELGFRLGIRSQKPLTLFNGALECKLLRLMIEENAFFIPKAKTAEERIQQVRERSLSATDSGTFSSVSSHENSERAIDAFTNRVHKNLKNLARWAKQNNISCYRVYDADLPEYAVAIDLYQSEKTWINIQEYEAPKTIDPAKANQRLSELLAQIPRIFSVPQEQIFLKIRRRQKNSDQYEKQSGQRNFHVIQEYGCKLLVNFQDYLDTGLFLDHRPMRLLIQQEAKNKRFLNLFAYTGSATIHAAIGGAISSTSVDLSKTYLDWAEKNLSLNQTRGQHEFIQSDCFKWLANEAKQLQRRQYDLIFLDPPTFSNSKRMDHVLDIQNDHITLITNAMALLKTGGYLYFSTNFRRFKLDYQALTEFKVDNISAKTIPTDFARNPKIHYCWRISRCNAE